MSRSAVVVGAGQPFMQTSAHSVGRVRITAALITHDEHTSRRDAGHTGQTEPLPDVAHANSVPTLHW